KRPTHGLKQEKSPLMELQMIRGITSKGQGNPPGTTAGNREVKTDHGDDTNDCRQLRSQIEEAVSPVSWVFGGKVLAIGEVLLEITIGNAPLTRSETLNFVIVRSNSPYNMLLGTTSMHKMGMVVLTIHGAVKFHTTQGIGIVFSTHGSEKIEGVKKVRETFPTVTIGKQLPEDFKERLRNLLRTNADVFAWTHADMTGIPRTSRCTERGGRDHKGRDIIGVRTLDMGSKPSHESLSGFRLKCFLDAYKGYHMIQMAEEDEDKTTFFVGEGVYFYRKMPFGLKNAGATYKRLVDKVFNDQIGRNLESYVDDMVIKSTSEEDMLADIKETFQRFRSINMKLNPKKCSFGVEEGPFLGHIITNANTWRSSNDVSRSFDGKHKRSCIREKGRRTGSYLLRKPSPTWSRAQLPHTRKTHTVVGTRSEKAAKIFLATYGSDPNQLSY
ncbi:reverse transcriptase domain-containing protein, partial [Tanacetum coccineum]